MRKLIKYFFAAGSLGAAIYYLPRARFLVRWLGKRASNVLFFVESQHKWVALTIDDGPHPVVTPEMLDLLAKYDAHATFFLLGERIPGNEHLVKQMLAEGHELGNHLMSDAPSISLTATEFKRQLQQAHALLSSFGTIRWFRPGSAWYNQEMLYQIRHYNYQCVLGDIYPYDAQIPSPQFSIRYILRHTRPGSVIILHSGTLERERTLDVLNVILPRLKEKGYHVVNLSELVAQKQRVASVIS